MGQLGRTIVGLIALIAAGCSSDSGPPPPVEGVAQSGGTGALRGLAGATIRLYAAGADEPELLATTTTNAAGGFAFSVPKADDQVVRFVRASLDGGIELVAVLGESVPEFVTVNELTTVAAAFAFAQFFSDAAIRGDALALSIAAGMNANLVDIVNGTPSAVLLDSPNGDQTNTLRSTRTLANLIAACVREPASCAGLFALVSPPDGPPVTNTLAALLAIARQPAFNVEAIYARAQLSTAFEPALVTPPDAWTLAVKVNQTGSAEMPFGGAANTVFDERGYAWINNNTVQGESISTMNVVVLTPDGRPADGSGGTPRSPVTGGGVLGAGFGITRNVVDGSIWVGNFGWGGLNPGPDGTGTGSVSQFAADGTPISGDDGYDGGTDRVQGIAADHDGNIWSANFGNDQLVVFRGGDPGDTASAALPCHPFGVAIGADGTAWVSTLGAGPFSDPTCDANSSLSRWQLTASGLERLFTIDLGDDLKGVDIDFDGYGWVASGGDDTVYRVAPDGTVAGAYQGGGIEAPWAVRIDDAGNVWVANFGHMDIVPPGNIYEHAALSVLAGPDSPSGLPVGTPISPMRGYTLPTAGAPVLLSDGTPLSETGDGRQPAFTPLMRAVSAVPDRAGNVWVSNNWKPNFTADLLGDPGGDGMVIFIGLAAPTEPGRTQ